MATRGKSPMQGSGPTLGVVAIGIEALVIAPLLGDIATTFDVSTARAAWAVSVYGLALAVTAPCVALFGARVPRKTTMAVGLLLFILSGLGCALASGFWTLLSARAVCGVASGAFLPACYAYVGDTTAYADRGRVMGRVMAGWSLALILGIPLGSWMAGSWGWRSPFVAVAALGAAAAWQVARLPASHARDIVPARLRDRLPGLRCNGIPLLLAITFFDVLSFYGIYTFLGVVVRERLAIGSGSFGLLVGCYGAGLLASTLNAALLDRFGKERVLAICLSGLAFVLVSLMQAIAHPVWLGCCMAAWGVLQGLVQTGTATLITRAAGDSARGLAMAGMSCVSYLAVGLASAAGGWLLAVFGFTGLAIAGALCAALAACLLARYRRLHATAI